MTVLLVALTIGAGIAVAAVLLLGVPGASTTTAAPPAAAPPTAAPPAGVPAPSSVPLSTRAAVIASASCTDPSARDLVELRGADGRPTKLPLDACGTPAGTIVPVTVPAGDPVAHLAGAGRAAGPASQASPMGQRLAVTLAAVAAVGVAGLLVALGRERWGRERWSRERRAPERSDGERSDGERRPARASDAS